MNSFENPPPKINNKQEIASIFLPFLSSTEFQNLNNVIFTRQWPRITTFLIYCNQVDSFLDLLSFHTKKSYPIITSILSAIYIFYVTRRYLPEYELSPSELKMRTKFKNIQFRTAKQIDLLDPILDLFIHAKITTKLNIKRFDDSLKDICQKFYKVLQQHREEQPFYHKFLLLIYLRRQQKTEDLVYVRNHKYKVRDNFINAACHYCIIAEEVDQSMSNYNESDFVAIASKAIKGQLSDGVIVDAAAAERAEDFSWEEWNEIILQHYDSIPNFAELENLQNKYWEQTNLLRDKDAEIELLKREIKEQSAKIEEQSAKIEILLSTITDLQRENKELKESIKK